jgi:hypothetical protein
MDDGNGRDTGRLCEARNARGTYLSAPSLLGNTDAIFAVTTALGSADSRERSRLDVMNEVLYNLNILQTQRSFEKRLIDSIALLFRVLLCRAVLRHAVLCVVFSAHTRSRCPVQAAAMQPTP